jgi:virginiamycin A acetyltransferase
MALREALKTLARGTATVAVTPALAAYGIRRLWLGPDRAVEGSSQALSLIPGLAGQYLRRAFFAQTLAYCDATAVIEFGTLFSAAGTRIDANVYIGPRCHIGLVHFERDVLLGPAVHVPSGAQTHGTADPDSPIREQGGSRRLVRIGAGTWIGSAAVVMADVGARTVVGAGAVVTRPLPDDVVAAGVPAKVLRHRREHRADLAPRTVAR